MKYRSPLGSLFEVQYGSQFDLNKMSQTTASDPERINFVSRRHKNLGVSAYVKPHLGRPPFPPGLITVALGGSYLLSAFVQERHFYTAQNVAVLTPKMPMGFAEKVFYCLCLRKNRFRYSAFGREANRTLALIEVPTTVPEQFRGNAICALGPNSNPILDSSIALDPTNWKDFLLSDLFDITGTKTTSVKRLDEYGQGKCPYVTTRASNNGVRDFFSYSTEKGNVLVIDSAVAGHCTYQADDFSASDHVEKLIPRFVLNQYVAMFLTTIINRSQFRYSYGRKASQGRLRQVKIRLPSTINGSPDWEHMEKFIKSLPHSRSL
ncbi:MAG: restriction endonuclease subunit S [Bacteroidetes bacterium]|nr:restriction endonuclease subunit S [Bacteroidota bacterium]